MHYYSFNIADYRKDTQHLTPIEHYIYRELLDWMYLDECPLPPDVNKILRRLRLPNDRLTDVEQVLNDFFIEREDGYIQERVLFEVNEYKRKIKSASKAGKASGKARRSKASERSLNGRSNPLNQPITNNHKPITNIKDISASADCETSKVPPRDPCPYSKIIDLYHEHLPMCPRVVQITDKRKTALRARWKNGSGNLEFWEEYFKHASESKFLTGQVNPSPGRKTFIADIDFLIRPDTPIKMQEGKYHD